MNWLVYVGYAAAAAIVLFSISTICLLVRAIRVTEVKLRAAEREFDESVKGTRAKIDEGICRTSGRII